MRTNLAPVLLAFAATGSQCAVAQYLLPSGGAFPAPDFQPSQPDRWEYSEWDCFYTPTDLDKTKSENRNFPDVAAPNGYAARAVSPGAGDVAPDGLGGYQFVGQYQGDYVWDFQSHPAAVTAGFAQPKPTNSNPADPFAIFHAANPSVRQHASSAFIIGPAYAGNIYSFAEKTAWTLEDSVDHDLGSVVFQLQNQGRDIDYSTLKLRYNLAGTPVEISPTDLIIEREAFASHAGFTFTTRNAAEWDLSGLGVRSYEIVFSAAGSSCSVQQMVLDTSDNYQLDHGIPAKRVFLGTTDSNWATGSNWQDAAGNSSAPIQYANVVFQGGSTLDIGSATRSISMLESANDADFSVIGAGNLELGTGFTAPASALPRNVNFNVPVHMTAYNFFDIGQNVTAVLNQPFSGNTGFEKRGDGNIRLLGDNTFSGALYLSGGGLTIAGANSYGSSATNSLDLTYLYLGTIDLESAGQLGAPGVRVVIGSTPYEIPGEMRPSHLVVKGQRTFAQPVEFTGGYNPKLLTFTQTGSGSVSSGGITLHNATPFGMFGAEASTGDVFLSTPLAADSVRFTGTLTGGAPTAGVTPHALRKTGPGTIAFGGSHKAYSHQTRVESGTLLLESGTNITGGNSTTVDAGATFTANGNLSLSGTAKLTVNGLLNGSGSLIRSGTPAITGSGTISRPLVIDAGTVLAPGNQLGTINLTGDQVWGQAGGLEVDLMATGGPAASDVAAITGSLSITATPAARFVIKLKSLRPDGLAGPVHDFNTAGTCTWTVATTTTGITGFAADKFSFDTSAFANGIAGTLAMEVQGNNLLLRYTGAAVTPVFSQWATALPAGLRGAADDADHDGIPNLVEFAIGTSGTTATAGPVLTLTRQNIAGAIYPVIGVAISEPVRPGVTLFLSSSTSLQNGSWQTLATKAGSAPWNGSTVITEGSINAGRKTYLLRDPSPADSSQPRFFRLEARNDQ